MGFRKVAAGNFARKDLDGNMLLKDLLSHSSRVEAGMYLLWQYDRFLDEQHHKLWVKYRILVHSVEARFDEGFILLGRSNARQPTLIGVIIPVIFGILFMMVSNHAVLVVNR